MQISENLRFVGKYILPPTIVVISVFLITFLMFPTFNLTFEVFTLIYWSFSVVSFLITYQTKRWTDYVINHHGLEREKNPSMRKMYATRDFKEYRAALIGMCVLLLVSYFIGINAGVFLPFLILPSLFLAVMLYDFLNDFYWLRMLKKGKVAT